MAQLFTYIDDQAGPYYAYRVDWSLADWLTNRVLLTSGSSPNAGRHTATLGDGTWVVFRGSTQPANWYEAVSSPVDIITDSSMGSGDYTVTITVEDSSTNDPIQGARVTLLESGNVIRAGYTAANGTIQFLMDDGSYTINVSAHGFDASIGTALTVDGNESVTIELDESAATTPSLPDTCVVRMVTMRGTTPIQTRVEITSSSVGRYDDIAFSNTAYSGLTDEDGVLEVELPRSSVTGVGNYRFRIIDIGNGKLIHDRTCTVPDLANADYDELEDA